MCPPRDSFTEADCGLRTAAADCGLWRVGWELGARGKLGEGSGGQGGDREGTGNHGRLERLRTADCGLRTADCRLWGGGWATEGRVARHEVGSLSLLIYCVLTVLTADRTFYSCILHSKNAGAKQLHSVTKTETVKCNVSRLRTAASDCVSRLRILLARRHPCDTV